VTETCPGARREYAQSPIAGVYIEKSAPADISDYHYIGPKRAKVKWECKIGFSILLNGVWWRLDSR